jgi:capsular exopolysaccharide synthesis family protein
MAAPDFPNRRAALRLAGGLGSADEREEATASVGSQLSVLWSRRWTIATITLLVVLAAMFFSYRATPVYVSTANVLVGAPGDQGGQNQPNMATEKTIASSTSVASMVIQRLHLTTDAKTLLKDVSIDVPVDSDILQFQVSDTSRAAAQAKTQAFAVSYLQFREDQILANVEASEQPLKDRIKQLTTQLATLTRQQNTNDPGVAAQISSLTTQIAILEQKLADLASPNGTSAGSVIQPATLPTSPARPKHVKDGALATFLGLLLGAGGALLRDRLDDRVRGRSDLEECVGAPILGVLPRVRGIKPQNGLVTQIHPEPLAAEGFRKLGTSFVLLTSTIEAKTVVITSARKGEGKSFVTANLGMALARMGKSVLIVSADLRRPTLEAYFGSPSSPGLADILMDPGSVTGALQVGPLPTLFVLPTGSPGGNPTELLGAADTAQLVNGLKEMVDYVLFDTPPILAVSDAAILASSCDAVLMVSRLGTSTRTAVLEARREVDGAGAVLIGGVLTGADEKSLAHYISGYGPETSAQARASLRRLR